MHSAVGRRRKILIYDSCVLSKLSYSLDSLWLLKQDRDRLDAFHCKCFRGILRIPHYFISRVSNVDVLDTAGSKPLSSILRERQVQLYRKIACETDESLVKRVVCNRDGTPKNWADRRRRGRTNWKTFASNSTAWRDSMDEYVDVCWR